MLFSGGPATDHDKFSFSSVNLSMPFKELDRAQWRLASARIAEQLIRRRPVASLGQPRRSEPAILLQEATKRRRFRPLRKLFADLPNLLPALKPCMLMSPLAVAQFLGESAMEFDLVIFDEASQILPADAIGAIGRAKQVVVVGDREQLPPTRFFAASATVAEEENEDDEPVPESILDACVGAKLSQKALLWHYRSRHEHLIAFSNSHIYGHRLVTFPSPDEYVRAVELIHVPNGVYDRGSASRVNRPEARRTVDLVLEHVRRSPKQSLGVITFSEPQMVAIQTELDARKRANPHLEELLKEEGPEGFFVKNLENVQGDERDVIIFSVGYGPDSAGRMTLNFGPLNKQGGERRLNVAVTRARDRVKIVASFTAEALSRVGTSSPKGVQLLKSYLQFAQSGPAVLPAAPTARPDDDAPPFEELVAEALRAHGLAVDTRVGVGSLRIDVAVKDKASGRYLLGVECDGLTYLASKTARDRDRLRQHVLERLGWRIARVWSTQWIKDPAAEIAKLLTAVEDARAGKPLPESHEPAGEEEPDGAPFATEVQAPRAPVSLTPIAVPYVAVVLPRAGTPEHFRVTSAARLAEKICLVVEAEGPVHEDRGMRAVAECYGIARVGTQVRAVLQHAIDLAVKAKQIQRRGAFLWPAQVAQPAVRAAGADGRVRPIGEVPPEEIHAAVVALLARAFSMGRDDMVSAVARELGYDRTGAQVAAAIGSVVSGMVDDGVLRDTGGQLALSAR